MRAGRLQSGKNGEKPSSAFSSFYTDAGLSSTIRKAKELMGVFPGASLVSDGTVVRYAIERTKNTPHSILELSGSGIRFYYPLSKPSRRLRQESLAEFLSILAYLSSSYDVKLSGLYGEIAEAITDASAISTQEEETSLLSRDVRIEQLSRSNFSLSNELLKSITEKSMLEKNVKLFNELLDFIVERFSGSGDARDPYGVLIRLGVEERVARGASEIRASEGS